MSTTTDWMPSVGLCDDSLAALRRERRARLREQVQQVSEVAQYMSLPSIEQEQDPLHWWQSRVYMFPFLSKLAKVSHCALSLANLAHSLNFRLLFRTLLALLLLRGCSQVPSA